MDESGERKTGGARLVLVRADPAAGDAPTSPSATPDGSPPDDVLAGRAAGGDRAAFEALVRRHQRMVLGFATRFLGQPALASDVAQETFVDLLRALPRYRPEGRFSVWLYRIALNRCRMAARSHRYEERTRERLFVERIGRLPPDEAEARERERRLQRALAGLPEKMRAVLQLRFYADLSHEEIARVLETKEGTVKSRLWNGLALLRRALEGER